MTLEELRDDVMSELGMSGTEEQTRVDRWINQGVVKILTLTSCEISTADVDLDAGQADYESDPDIIATIEVFNKTQSRPLEKLTLQELLEKRLYGQATGGIMYYASQADTFSFYPTPDTATEITIYYVPYPTTLSDAGSEPSEVPREWHHLIGDYAKWKAASWDDDASSQNGDRYMRDFNDGIKAMRYALQRKTGRRIAPARVNPRARNIPYSDPSRTWY